MKWLILISLTIAVFSLGFYSGSTTVKPNDKYSEVATKTVLTESPVPTPLSAQSHTDNQLIDAPTTTSIVTEALTQAEQIDLQESDLPYNSDVLTDNASNIPIEGPMINPEIISGEMSDEELMEMDEDLALHLAMEGKVLSDEIIEDTGELMEDVLPEELLELESQTPILFGQEVTVELNDEDFDLPLIEVDNINE